VGGAEAEFGDVVAFRVLVQQEAKVGRGLVGSRDRQEHAGFTPVSLLGHILADPAAVSGRQAGPG
jgi:hypothetical protein